MYTPSLAVFDSLVRINSQDMAARSPLAISLDQRRQTFVTCELGQVVPKVLIVRSFPEDFKVLGGLQHIRNTAISWNLQEIQMLTVGRCMLC